MAVETFESPFIVVVETNGYTGSMEREFCAYVTGQVGECGVGNLLAEEYHEEETYDFGDSMQDVPDDNGCRRPVSIYPGKDHKYHSLVMFFEYDPTLDILDCMGSVRNEREIDIIRRRAKTYCEEIRVGTVIHGIEVFSNEVKRVLTKIE